MSGFSATISDTCSETLHGAWPPCLVFRVIALPAPPILLTPKGIEHVGPRAFGYDLDFRSVFA